MIEIRKKIVKSIKILFRILSGIIPKNSKRVVFKSNPDFSGNGKAFSDYLLNVKCKYDVVWIVSDCSTEFMEGITIAKKGTFKALWLYVTSKYIITTHNEMIGTRANNQIYISLWHGMPMKKICYLGEFDHQGMEDYSSLRIATSEIMRSIISACFREKANNVYVTGQPRNDYLFDNSIRKTDFYKDIKSKYERIVFYTPTFRENQEDARYSDGVKIEGHNFLRTSDFDLDLLNRYFADNNTLLLLKLHPFEEKSITNSTLGSNIRVVTSQNLKEQELDINHILSMTDVLISDYSSIYFDFMILNKPIVFLVPDKEQYEKSRGGFVLEPFESWTPGSKVVTQKALLDEISEIKNGNDKYSDKRNEVNHIINKFNDNKNCERVYKFFFSED
ncbi:CDP-glycerol glycerophosphotransferase family protein [Vibrio sp. 1F255]|uniref:CDP-glycerol glycerophosphotransferase family protein n=1 Tax=Vibrio sp. 1F255 TaxID=3230009 RepID=UPI00352E45CA